MEGEKPASLSTQFPYAQFLPELRLWTWHPHGVLDDELVDQIVAFVEWEEGVAEESFNRFTDLTGLTEIRLKVGHVFEVARQRREAFAGREPVKSAFYAEKVVGFGVARMYETLMEGSPVQARAFRTREAAAAWLGVPLEAVSGHR